VLPHFAVRNPLENPARERKAAVNFANRVARPHSRCRRLPALFAVALAAALAQGHSPASAAPQHAIAMHGEPALPADFDHLPYANPNAPKGGRITYGNIGTFDSLNPFIVMGTAPRGLWDVSWGNNVWESLLVRNRDEPFTLYGLLAESVDVPPDRSSIEFTLRQEARFSDGQPVTVDDVLFSFDLLKTKGRPNYRSWFEKVAKTEKTGERSFRLTFEAKDREIPLLIGLVPIFPKHATDAASFDKSSLAIPVGSGPYSIESVEPGRAIVLRRNPDYWGKDLPMKRGLDNFDEIRVEYYRDVNGYFEAFKKGLFDYLPETDPGRWSIGYDFPAAKDGRVVLDTFKTGTPKGMNAFVFNTRRPIFADARVREAFTYFFDFEWLNKNLYYGLYQRTGSFFQGSDLSALGQPASEKERALLAPFPDAVRADVMDGTYAPPVSDGSGRDRNSFMKGLALLKEAGYAIKDRTLVNAATGAPFTFEFIAQTKDQERLALAFQRELGLIGITMNVRLLDSAQYWTRQKAFDFDMMQFTYTASLSPGNEQLFRWSSKSAATQGSFNFAGASSPALDAMLQALLQAETQEDFVAAARALDRVLISGFYVVPLFNSPEEWAARWTRLKEPERASLAGPEPTTWWAAQ
jgi:peptide/nickel transport system substrate-binding protein